ncbi:MAG: Ig-like domain-containing protein [Muribaculaceae bacterium]|nr:Ig-like domain-containing protein [Muribaculaceae bacterium]
MKSKLNSIEKRQLLFLGSIISVLLAGVSCASIGNPTGGARDEEPPRFVRANPAPGSTNVNRQRIDIDFNEIVNVKDAFSKVVISPVSKEVPRVSSLGRRVTVTFNDTLKENTTYTIDFGNSIEDNNEGNKLQGFTYTFSTGPDIDTLQISGMVLSADALEPQQGMLVGIYSNLSDTAFSTLPFERVAKTDDRGRFSIKGLKAGEYRIFALNDVDNDYKRANPEEATAFYDVTLVPTSERIMTTDTIYNFVTGTVDTVINRERTRFLPNDILLRSFESDYKPQYLQKYERVDSTRLSFIFNAPSDTLPIITPVGYEDLEDWYVLERTPNNDTLTYWIKPQVLLSLDSLRISATYLRTDTAKNLTASTDTLRFFYSRELKKALADAKKAQLKLEKMKEKRREKELKRLEKEREQRGETGEPIDEQTLALASDSIGVEPPKPAGFKVTSSATQEVFLPIFMEFDTPLTRLDSTAFHLEIEIDSVWSPVKQAWRLEPVDSGNPRKLKIEYPWDYETQYRLTVDSLAAENIYGLVTDPLEFKFKTKSEDDYSAFIFDIVNFVDSVPAFMELLNASDSPIRKVPVQNGRAEFRFLPAGKYYARIYEDFNGNGLYDTGDVEKGIQPDLAYYYPKVLNIKKNWERQETWDVFATAIDLMKPDNIKKNKPEADKRSRNRKNIEEDEDEEEEFDPTRNPFDPNDRGRGY